MWLLMMLLGTGLGRKAIRHPLRTVRLIHFIQFIAVLVFFLVFLMWKVHADGS